MDTPTNLKDLAAFESFPGLSVRYLRENLVFPLKQEDGHILLAMARPEDQALQAAMEVALKAEEKAFDFFDGALKHVKDPEVRKLFEELRAEEVQHQEYVKKAMATLPTGPDVEESEADAPGSDAG